jgi:hypothetical protein
VLAVLAKLVMRILALAVFVALLSSALYVGYEAKRNLDASFSYTKLFRVDTCLGNYVNCTSEALENMYRSTQHLLIGVVELFVAAVLLILAFMWIAAYVKMELNLAMSWYWPG